MEEESTTEGTLQPEVINKQEDGYLVAVAGSLEGRSSRATDADDSSLGNIGEEEEEDSEGDYIELPALTKPCSHDHPSSSTSQSEEGGVATAEPSKKFSKDNLQLEKKAGKEKKEAAEESSKVRGRSNSLFKILGRRQKLVEEAEQKKDDEKLDEGEEDELEAEVPVEKPPKKSKSNKKSGQKDQKPVTRSRSNSLFLKLGIRQKLVEDFQKMELLEEDKTPVDELKDECPVLPTCSMKSREDLVKPIKGFGGFGRRNSLFKKLERRQKKIENPDDHVNQNKMTVFNPLIEFRDMLKSDIIKYEETFHEFDTDNNGLLTLEEIKSAMRKLGTVMTHMEFKNIINELDTDGDKMLDLREFICIFHKLKVGDGSALLNKMVEEIEVASVGVGGAKNFFEDKAARTKETSYETELRLEREELQRKKQEEEERRKKLASKAAAFGDVKIGKKPTTAQKQPSKLKIKKIRSKQDVTKSNDSSGSGNLERQTSSVSGGSGGGLERQGSNISNSNFS